jgi:16S rRNA (cytosine1402-N4)-methyltransferase
MSDFYHTPVLADQVINFLISNKSGIYIDGTLGGGGHAEKILNSLSEDGTLIGIDVDAEALTYSSERLKEFGLRVALRKTNFADLSSILSELGIKQISGLLLDLGVSSRQIDNQRRGFSYRLEGRLDMRMDQTQDMDAQSVVNGYSEKDLSRIFFEYGEEKNSKTVAKTIIQYRKTKDIATTQELARIVSSAVPHHHLNKTLSRIFQALRIEVNSELDNLRQVLTKSLSVLEKGGRIVVISYHSLEDRIVKDFFRFESLACTCPPGIPQCVCGKQTRLRVLTRNCLIPSSQETMNNPRSRSAKLRAAERA